MKSFSVLALAAVATCVAAQDPCHSAHTDQASCDADKKTGGGCTVSELYFEFYDFSISNLYSLLSTLNSLPSSPTFSFHSGANVPRSPRRASHWPIPKSFREASINVTVPNPRPNQNTPASPLAEVFCLIVCTKSQRGRLTLLCPMVQPK